MSRSDSSSGVGDGRKRPWNPSTTSAGSPASESPSPRKKAKTKTKKKKKLSAVALRALAALESDSSSVSGDDERNVESGDVLGRSSVENTTAIASDVGDGTMADGGEKEATKKRKIDAIDGKKKAATHGDKEKEGGDHSVCESPVGDTGGEDTRGEFAQHSALAAAAAAETVDAILSVGNDAMEGVADSDTSKAGASKEVAAAATTTAIASPTSRDSSSEEDDEEIVCPHDPKSDYSDVLAPFLSTPFDDKTMLLLHKLKDKSNGENKKKKSKKSTKDSDYVPILPQKQYVRLIREEKRAMEERKRLVEAHQQDATFGATSAALSAEVTSFLMQEGQNMLNSPLLQLIANQQQQQQQQAALQQQIAAQHQQQLMLQHRAVLQHQMATQQQRETLLQQATQQQLLQSLQQSNSWQYPSAPAPAHGALQHLNSWQYPAAAAPSIMQTQNAYHNNLAHAAQAMAQNSNTMMAQNSSINAAANQAQPANNLKSAPKVVSSSKEVEMSQTSSEGLIQDVAKLPVAFGFWVDDDGSSKKKAEVATEKWTSKGTKAAKLKTERRRNSGGSQKEKENKATPGAKSGGSSGTPKTPRTPAKLLSSKSEVSGLPTGWTSKTYERKSGKTAGSTDTYFYSPQVGIKFRSIKRCKEFIEIVKEVNGNESQALKLFKERGHKM